VALAIGLNGEGLFHDGVFFNVFGKRHHIDFAALTGPASLFMGRTKVVKDLIGARVATGQPLLSKCPDVSVHEFDSKQPKIRLLPMGNLPKSGAISSRVRRFSQALCRPAIESQIRTYERVPTPSGGSVSWPRPRFISGAGVQPA
jgi:p-hydroxybenzoate 3-monooxygenase